MVHDMRLMLKDGFDDGFVMIIVMAIMMVSYDGLL